MLFVGLHISVTEFKMKRKTETNVVMAKSLDTKTTVKTSKYLHKCG